MRIDRYNYQFEKETTGKYLRRVNFANMCLSVSTFVLLMTGAFVYLNKSHTNNENVIQLQQKKTATTTSYLKGTTTDIWITSVPSEFPSMIPYLLENDEYNDDDESFESFLRKSKYPTHHPKRKTTVPTAFIENTILSSGMVTEELTSSPTPVMGSDSPMNIAGSSKPTPIIIIATDDFHTTPIVVVNTEGEESDKPTQDIIINPYYAHMSGKIHE